MKRTYLEEDIELIQRYFPGAKAVALRTPFGSMHTRRQMPRLAPDSFQDTAANPHESWVGGMSWTS